MFVCVVHEIPYYHCVYMCLCVQSMKYPTTTVCICVCVCRGMCHGAWKEVRWQVSGISTLFLPLCGIWRWNSGCYAVPGAFAPLSYTTGLFTKSLMSDMQPDKPPSQQVFILSHKAFIWLLFLLISYWQKTSIDSMLVNEASFLPYKIFLAFNKGSLNFSSVVHERKWKWTWSMLDWKKRGVQSLQVNMICGRLGKGWREVQSLHTPRPLLTVFSYLC